jgi:hypothetical protein
MSDRYQLWAGRVLYSWHRTRENAEKHIGEARRVFPAGPIRIVRVPPGHPDYRAIPFTRTEPLRKTA